MALAYLEGSEVPSVPAGTYRAEFVSVESATTRFGAALKWTWRLPDEDDFELRQMTSTATSSGSNGGRILLALRGRGLAPGERLSTAELARRGVTLTLSVDPSSGWNRVEAVHPAPTRRAKPEPVPEVNFEGVELDEDQLSAFGV